MFSFLGLLHALRLALPASHHHSSITYPPFRLLASPFRLPPSLNSQGILRRSTLILCWCSWSCLSCYLRWDSWFRWPWDWGIGRDGVGCDDKGLSFRQWSEGKRGISLIALRWGRGCGWVWSRRERCSAGDDKKENNTLYRRLNTSYQTSSTR